MKASQIEQREPESTEEILKGILAWAFYSLGGFLLLCGLCVLLMFSTIATSLQKIITWSFVEIILLMYGIIAIMWGRSVKRIKDRQYLVGFFSAIVALTALVFSIVT